MNKVYGIDPGRSSFTVANLGGDTRSFPNTEPGYQSCLSWIGQEPVIVVVEGRGNGVSRLCVLLKERGQKALEVNPMTSGRLSEAMTQDKTDKLDAMNLARIGALMGHELSEVRDDYRTLALREMGRELSGIKKDLNKHLNRLHRLLALTYGPAYRRMFPRISPLALSFYEAFPSAALALEAGSERIAEFLTEHGGRRYGYQMARKRAEAIMDILNHQDHFPQDIHIQTLCRRIKRLIREIELLREQKEEVIDQINNLAPDEVNLLCSLRGVNRTLAAVIISEIGSIGRFGDSRSLACYAGLTPAQHQSGNTFFTTSRHRCNRILKWAFYHLAMLRIRYDPDAKQYYQRKISEGKKPFQARAAVARVQVGIIWSILTRGTPYV